MGCRRVDWSGDSAAILQISRWRLNQFQTILALYLTNERISFVDTAGVLLTNGMIELLEPFLEEAGVENIIYMRWGAQPVTVDSRGFFKPPLGTSTDSTGRGKSQHPKRYKQSTDHFHPQSSTQLPWSLCHQYILHCLPNHDILSALHSPSLAESTLGPTASFHLVAWQCRECCAVQQGLHTQMQVQPIRRANYCYFVQPEIEDSQPKRQKKTRQGMMQTLEE